MRCNQVSIFVERFGKYVPKDYPADVQRVHVYCDDGASVYAALLKAYACVINELNEYEHIGARCDVSTNEFSYVVLIDCGFEYKIYDVTDGEINEKRKESLYMQKYYVRND